MVVQCLHFIIFFEFFKLELFLPMCYLFIHDKKNVSYNKQYKYIYYNLINDIQISKKSHFLRESLYNITNL